MACREFEDLILDYCDGAATPADHALLESHIAGCGDCRAFLATQQELDRRLQDSIAHPALSPAFGPRLAGRIAAQRHAPRFRRLPKVLDWIGYLSLALVAGRLVQQVPDAGAWLAMAGVAGSVAFSFWKTGKALRSNYGHR
jgi:anti-sigma factor RsiW